MNALMAGAAASGAASVYLHVAIKAKTERIKFQVRQVQMQMKNASHMPSRPVHVATKESILRSTVRQTWNKTVKDLTDWIIHMSKKL